MKPVAQCKVCDKTLTTEEIEVGTSLVCPRCKPGAAKPTEQEKDTAEDIGPSAEKE